MKPACPRLSAVVLVLACAAVAAGEAPVAAAVADPRSWSGQVHDNELKPVAGARVEIRHGGEILEPFGGQLLVDKPPTVLASAITGAEGDFRIALDAEGLVLVTVDAEGYFESPVPIPTWELTEPGELLVFRGQVLPVRVADPNGDPVEGARLLVRNLFFGGWVVATGPDGWADVPRLGMANLQFWALPPPQRADLLPSGPYVGSGNDMRVSLTAAAPRALRVLHDGRPAAGVVVAIDDAGGDEVEKLLAVTGEDGRVAVPQPLSGESLVYHLVDADDHWARVEMPTLSAEAGEARAAETVVSLSPPTEVAFRILTPDGLPVAGAFAYWPPGRRARTGEDGSLTFRLPRGGETLQPTHFLLIAPGFESATIFFDLAFIRGIDAPTEYRLRGSDHTEPN